MSPFLIRPSKTASAIAIGTDPALVLPYLEINKKASVLSLTVWANSAYVMYVVHFLLMSGRQRGAVNREAERGKWEIRTSTGRAHLRPRDTPAAFR